MTEPLVSVIVPAFNQATYLGGALQSVLDQSFDDFEVVVVDDGSTDGTREVVGRFTDPRVRCVAHPRNLGLSAARNSGLRAASGEIVAFLDADDLFHPNKLRTHVDFLRGHPDVGVSYNARFEMDTSGSFLSIWRPPLTVSLADLVLGFPFDPSDMVLRRDWAFRVGLLNEGYTFYGEDLDFNCRLALAGCRFAGIDRALNYRRYYPGKINRDPRGACASIVRVLETVFSHPSCPPELLSLQRTALANVYMAWSYEAFIAGDAALGRELLRRAINMDPVLLEGDENRFLQFLVHRSTQDGGEHEEYLKRVFTLLPEEMSGLGVHRDRVIGRGYLVRGVRAALWQRRELADSCAARAVDLKVRPDSPFLQFVLDQLLSFEGEMGRRTAESALGEVCRFLLRVGGRANARWLGDNYRIRRAFADFGLGRYHGALSGTLKAVAADPSHLRNQDVRHMLAHSLMRALGLPRMG